MRKKVCHKIGIGLGYFSGVFAALLMIISWSSLAQAAPLPLPPRFTPTPTVTPTPTPTPTPQSQTDPAMPDTDTGTLKLIVKAPANSASLYDWTIMWTVVQWQDDVGEWHDVEGWRDVLDQVDAQGGYKTWSVPEDMFGDGPFRWLVYDQQYGTLLVASNTYHLPASKSETVIVEVTLATPDAPLLLPVTGQNPWRGIGMISLVLLLLGALAVVVRKR